MLPMSMSRGIKHLTCPSSTTVTVYARDKHKLSTGQGVEVECVAWPKCALIYTDFSSVNQQDSASMIRMLPQLKWSDLGDIWNRRSLCRRENSPNDIFCKKLICKAHSKTINHRFPLFFNSQFSEAKSTACPSTACPYQCVGASLKIELTVLELCKKKWQY